MNADINAKKPSHAASSGSFSTHKQTQIDELLAQMHLTSDPEELVQMAEQLKMLAQKPTDDMHTFGEDELPDWAIREDGQDSIDAFFNPPEDQNATRTAFTIPRGEADTFESVSRPADAFMPQVPAEPGPVVEPVAPPVIEAVKEFTHEPEPVLAPEANPPHEPEPVLAPEANPPHEPEPATLFSQESSGACETEMPSLEVPAHELEQRINAEAPRRADFANFRCIYESQDGQLAIYEDKDGHITAVNTNRFV